MPSLYDEIKSSADGLTKQQRYKESLEARGLVRTELFLRHPTLAAIDRFKNSLIGEGANRASVIDYMVNTVLDDDPTLDLVPPGVMLEKDRVRYVLTSKSLTLAIPVARALGVDIMELVDMSLTAFCDEFIRRCDYSLPEAADASRIIRDVLDQLADD